MVEQNPRRRRRRAPIGGSSRAPLGRQDPWRGRVSNLRLGQRVVGKVTEIQDHGATIDLGQVLGWLPAHECSWIIPRPPLTALLDVGQHVALEVISIDAVSRHVQLSARSNVEFRRSWDRTVSGFTRSYPRSGTIIRLTENGYSVDVGGVLGWLPISEIRAFERSRRLELFDPVSVEMLPFQRELMRIPLRFSRPRPAETHPRGTILSVRVTHVAPGAVWVSALEDNTTGVITIGETKWGSARSPVDQYHVGEEITVYVMGFNDIEGMYNHSHRRAIASDFEAPNTKVVGGEHYTVEVKEVLTNGLLVDVEGYAGFIRKDQITWYARENPHFRYDRGDTILAEARGAGADGQVPMSIKRAKPDEWRQATEHLKPDTIHGCTVVTASTVGLYVAFDRLAGRWLVPANEIAWGPIADPRAHYAPGETISVRVLQVDESSFAIHASIKRVTDPGGPPDDQLERLIMDHEIKTVEFKESFRTNRARKGKDREATFKCLRAIASMINTYGGTVLIGVDDDGIVRGIEVDGFESNDDTLKIVSDTVQQRLGARALSYLDMRVVERAAGSVLLVECGAAVSGPVWLAGSKGSGLFTRAPNSTREIPFEELNGFLASWDAERQARREEGGSAL